MCRLMAYAGPEMVLEDLLIKPNNSLVNQTRSDQGYHPGEVAARQAVDGDGFGFGWYPRSRGGVATRYASVHPAWNDANLHALAASLEAGHVVAHIRAAPPGGDISPDNCHPFASGRYLFAHNGWVGNMGDIKRTLFEADAGGERLINDTRFKAIQGSTDSEICFAMLLSAIDRLGKEAPRVDDLCRAVEETIATIVRYSVKAHDTFGSKLNFVLSDGHAVVATRFVHVPPDLDGPVEPSEPFPNYDPKHALSLYWAQAPRFALEGERLVSAGSGQARAFIAASEPLTRPEGAALDDVEELTRQTGWTRVDTNRMLSWSPETGPRERALEV